MDYSAAEALVIADQREGFTPGEYSDDELIANVRATMVVEEIEGDDATAQAYRIILANPVTGPREPSC